MGPGKLHGVVTVWQSTRGVGGASQISGEVGGVSQSIQQPASQGSSKLRRAVTESQGGGSFTKQSRGQGVSQSRGREGGASWSS